MLHSLKLTDVAPFADSLVEFSPRLNLLTGDNGIGKSFLLELVWHSLSQTWGCFDTWFESEGTSPPQVVVSGLQAETETAYQKTWNYRFEQQQWMMQTAHGRQEGGIQTGAGRSFTCVQTATRNFGIRLGILAQNGRLASATTSLTSSLRPRSRMA